METFLDFMKEYNSIILIAVLALLFILIIMQIINKVHLSRISKRYKKLFRNSKTNTIEDMIIEHTNKVEDVLNYTKEVHKAYNGIDDRINACVQKIGMVRYKAFEDVGSDLSFSVALLDETDSGVVITSIYGRNDSTTFAKQIDKGISKYDISDEEREAIEKAQKHYENYNKHRVDKSEKVHKKRKDKDYYDNNDEFKDLGYEEEY